jgi:uncharacterized protein YciI
MRQENRMFIILLNYKESLAEIEKQLEAHRAFLDNGYKKNYFISSGPKNPRTGGVILSQLTNRDQLNDIINQDPFHIHDLAEYQIIEFTPVKYHPDFQNFINSAQ